MRFAGATQSTELCGDIEILTLAGSLSPDGAHLHISVADAQGRVSGGHVARGCIVRTTAELLLALLPEHRFSREPDAVSGFSELVVRARS
ncbi:hypothetical protein CAter282_1446 [Collimonas arenae]|uniref:PPC domain-containing protein n=1 Tax=Collimonas arenae TaxID=279058 RepID=A0A127QHE9_9BURK|nr:hypothetical protein CAter10_1566 [Collimonas arenae]AMP09235.1 hypothetical protein CAter282_1446 [Collimonas arenae]